MPDHPDPTQQEQGASHILPPFFAPRARPRRATPPGAAATARSRLAPLFTPPGAGRQLGAAPETDDPSALTDAAHGLEVESVSAPVSFAPEAEVEAIAANAAVSSDLPEPAVGESSFAASTSDLDVEFAGGTEVVELVLEGNAETAEHQVAHEPGTWPVVIDDVDDAVPSLGGEMIDERGDRLELEPEEWLPEPRSESLIEAERFWAAAPTQPASGDFAGSAHLDQASDAELAPEAAREVIELTEPDDASLAAVDPIDADQVYAAADEYVEQPTMDVPSQSRGQTAGDELTEALAWPTEPASQPAGGMPEAHAIPAEQALADAAPELRESAAPWADESAETVVGSEYGVWESPESLTLAPATDADPELAVADALYRVAQRIRDGELPLPTDAGAATDEGALAMVLAALLRGGHRG